MFKRFSDQSWFCVQITALEVLGRQRLKATVKQPPVIDPRTGQEVIIEPEGVSSQDTDDSDDTSDIEAEYFEAEVGIWVAMSGLTWCLTFLLCISKC